MTARKLAQMPPPMSVEQIAAIRARRAARGLEWLSRNAELLVLASMLMLPLSMAASAVWASVLGPPDAGRAVFWWGFRAAGVIFALGVVGLWVDPLAPVNEVQRDAVLSALATIPNGQDFRGAVAAQGREFTQREWRRAIAARLRGR